MPTTLLLPMSGAKHRTAATMTVTATLTAASGAGLVVIEVSGQDTATFIDVTHTGVGTATTAASGATALTSLLSFCVGAVMDANAASPTAPTFGTALTSQTSETAAIDTVSGGHLGMLVVDGLLAPSVAQTFGATVSAFGWVASVMTFLHSGTIARVQAASSGTIAATTSTPHAVLAAKMTTGNGAIVIVSGNGAGVGTVSGVADSGAVNTYTRWAAASSVRTNEFLDVWYCKSVA